MSCFDCLWKKEEAHNDTTPLIGSNNLTKQIKAEMNTFLWKKSLLQSLLWLSILAIPFVLSFLHDRKMERNDLSRANDIYHNNLNCFNNGTYGNQTILTPNCGIHYNNSYDPINCKSIFEKYYNTCLNSEDETSFLTLFLGALLILPYPFIICASCISWTPRFLSELSPDLQKSIRETLSEADLENNESTHCAEYLRSCNTKSPIRLDDLLRLLKEKAESQNNSTLSV